MYTFRDNTRRERWLGATVLAATIIVLGCSEGAPRAATVSEVRSLVIQGGRLIDGTGRAALEDAVVVVRNGKIEGVGRKGDVAVPSDATLIEAEGKTIIPGLIDSHVHYNDFYQPMFLYWGVTTVADLGNVRSWILAEKSAAERADVLGPSILAVGSMFVGPRDPDGRVGSGERSGFDTFINGNGYRDIVTDKGSVDAAFAEAKRLGVDAIKLHNRMDPKLMKVAVEAAHRLKLPIFAHFSGGATGSGMALGTDEILETGIDMHVHMFGIELATVGPDIRQKIIRGELPHPEYLMDETKFDGLIQQMIQRKMYLNPTLAHHWAKFSKFRNEFDELNSTFLAGPIGSLLSGETRQRFGTAYKPFAGEHGEQMELGYEKSRHFVKRFVESGGKLLAGADTGISTTPGVTIHVEMQTLSEAGLKPIDVIQAATRWPAEAFGKGDEFGTVEPGKRADILILNSDPLENIANTRDIFTVIKDGQIIQRQQLATWQDTIPRPIPIEFGRPNPLIHIPFIYDVAPGSVAVSSTSSSPILTLTGEHFSTHSKVLFNDQLIQPTFVNDKQLKVPLGGHVPQEPGTYPIAVVWPGSGGGVSNTLYLMVTPD